MSQVSVKEITVQISENQTIVELSKSIQPFHSDIYLKKYVKGNPMEINIKSFLGLITLQLQNNDRIQVRAVGEDSEEALKAVVDYLT